MKFTDYEIKDGKLVLDMEALKKWRSELYETSEEKRKENASLPIMFYYLGKCDSVAELINLLEYGI